MVPPTVDVVTFAFRSEGESKKVIVTSGPGALRVDEPTEGYSFIYNPVTQFYTGLEHLNYSYWEFSWPEVRTAVEKSARHEQRLQQLNNEGLNPDSAPGDGSAPPQTPAPSADSGTLPSSDNASADTNAAPSVNTLPPTQAPAPPPGSDAGSLGGGDDSGYVWKPTTEKKRIAGLDCIHWTGETISGENCDVWCYAGTAAQGDQRHPATAHGGRADGAGAGAHHRARLHFPGLRRADPLRRDAGDDHLGRRPGEGRVPPRKDGDAPGQARALHRAEALHQDHAGDDGRPDRPAARTGPARRSQAVSRRSLRSAPGALDARHGLLGPVNRP
ncbi:MAG: hypothetical protein WDO13_07580 [Verrucomicrobiota bacterium]